jgi:hypothetical protein
MGERLTCQDLINFNNAHKFGEVKFNYRLNMARKLCDGDNVVLLKHEKRGRLKDE